MMQTAARPDSPAARPDSGAGDIVHDPRWRAVLARDRAADGTFVYSVRTTGVYCRPSCAARRPNPQNVRFHASCADADAAGFRPCRRCRPAVAPGQSPHRAAIAAICRGIAAGQQMPSLAAMARRAGLSPHHFHRVFKAATGLTPKGYATAVRAGRIRAELTKGGRVTDAIYEAGFNSGSRFYAHSQDALGMTPARYRDGGDSLRIRFAVGRCSLGSVLVASTDRGVCAILLGDDPDTLVRDLQDRFPRADLVGGDHDFERTVARVVGFVDAPRLGLDLPLDVRGTAFQQRVWDALRTIPAGQVASYAEIAARIGAPGSARAVAQACAANPLAVAIPCHRVVRQDGALSGYRWGIARKRDLLDREAASQMTAAAPRPPRTRHRPSSQ